MSYTPIPPAERLRVWRTYAAPLLKDKTLHHLAAHRSFALFETRVLRNSDFDAGTKRSTILWLLRSLWCWLTGGEDPAFTERGKWARYIGFARAAYEDNWPLEPIPRKPWRNR